MNVLPIFYPNISYSLPSLFFLNDMELLWTKKKQTYNQWVKRDHQNILGDVSPMRVAFSDYYVVYLSDFLPVKYKQVLVQIWQNLYGFPMRAGISLKNVVKILWHIYMLFEKTMLHCDHLILWTLYRGTKLRLTVVILIWYFLC